MDTANILNDLREQRDRINNAIIALERTVGNGRRGRRPGRPQAVATTNGRRGRRRLSAAAKKRISEAAKARWAKAKKAGKSSLAKE